jgi:hypothetical protein
MNTSQLIALTKALNEVGLELLDISITTKDLETGIKVGKANKKLLEISNVLTEHLSKQEIEL